MPPYLVAAPPSLDASGWRIPNPEHLHQSWEEFRNRCSGTTRRSGKCSSSRQPATRRGGRPASMSCPPWTVNVEMDQGRRRLHRSASSTSPTTCSISATNRRSVTRTATARSRLAGARTAAADVLTRYATTLVRERRHPHLDPAVSPDANLSDEQILALKADWVTARMSAIGEPAVLTGGAEWEAGAAGPGTDGVGRLVETQRIADRGPARRPTVPGRVASGGDSMTYSNVSSIFDYHWRSGLAAESRRGHGRPVGLAAPPRCPGGAEPGRVRAAGPLRASADRPDPGRDRRPRHRPARQERWLRSGSRNGSPTPPQHSRKESSDDRAGNETGRRGCSSSAPRP